MDAVADPGECVAADATIRTGAHRDRVPAIFEPVMTDAVAFLGESGASLYVHGSVISVIVKRFDSLIGLWAGGDEG